MQRTATLIVTTITTLSLLMAVPANAIPSDDAVRAGCLSAKSALSQTEKNDAVLRINRGRIYNEVSDLLYAMNARISNNRRSAPKLSQITEDFNDELSKFKDTYNKYDDKLVELTKSDCSNAPSDFYSGLVSVRQGRENLKDSVEKLDRLVEEYSDSFKSLKESIND